MSKKKKIVVIGGGAAGLISSIIAARNGSEVIILDRMNRVGKKILATGNGRCNLTNMYIDIKRFHGKNPKFALGALNSFDVNQTIDFFEQLGIACKEEDAGKVFPYSDQATSVLDILRYEVERLGIIEQCDSEVEKIHPSGKEFFIYLKDGRKIKGDNVIIATGGQSSPNLGSNGSGYNLAISLGHKLVEPVPALVQLKLNSPFLKAIKGVKFIGDASIGNEDKVLRMESGEILFTEYGISGPPILQLSRLANEQISKNSSPWVSLDMFPNLSTDNLLALLETRISYNPKKTLEFSFVGLLNKRLIPVVLKGSGIENIQKPCCQLTSSEKLSIIKTLKKWKIDITGSLSWAFSQVTAGGIDVRDINPNSMESKLVPGLYFAGEILDIDGDCGGFNLQWAWSSGYLAGLNVSIR
jgi:predicted Rossmann fold flavoprotein